MVCSGAYPEAPLWPMLSTVESVVELLSGAAPAVGTPTRATSISRANVRTIVNLDLCTFLYPPSKLSLPSQRREFVRVTLKAADSYPGTRADHLTVREQPCASKRFPLHPQAAWPARVAEPLTSFHLSRASRAPPQNQRRKRMLRWTRMLKRWLRLRPMKNRRARLSSRCGCGCSRRRRPGSHLPDPWP